MADQQPTTLDEALKQIEGWISTGEKEKAKQGLQEVLEFDPSNTRAKEMMAKLTAPVAPIPAAPAPVAPAPAVTAPSPMPAPQMAAPTPAMAQTPKPPMPTPAPTPTKPAPVAPPTPVSVSAPKPAPTPTMPISNDAEKAEKIARMKKMAILTVSTLILLGGVWYLVSSFLGESTPETVPTETVQQDESTTPSEAAKSIFENTDVGNSEVTPPGEKVKRRDLEQTTSDTNSASEAAPSTNQ